MKRILFVTKNLILAGAQKHIVDLANGLSGKGFKIAILVFDTKGRDGARIKDINPEIEIISPHGNYFKPFFLGGTYEAVKAIRKWRPDVLCSMLWGTKTMVAILGRLLKTKVVLVESGSPLRTLADQKHKSFTFFYRKNTYSLADVVIAVSKGSAQATKELYRLNEVKAIHNGIDIEEIRTKSKAVGGVPHEYFYGNQPVLVATGRLSKVKGYEYLLEAFSIVNETTEVRLIIVGDGNLKDELCGMAKSLGIDQKVDIVGEREPYGYMGHADIFVLPSLYEGFSIVLLEAASLGLPIVSTECDHGPNEIIENGKSGLLVPVADSVKLASAILRLIEDKKLRSDLASEAEKRSQCFTRDRMVSSYEKVFLDL